MKRRWTIWIGAACIALAAVASVGKAQDAPSYIPVQGLLTDDTGSPLDGNFVLELRLYALATGGVAFYAESQTVSIDEGLFTIYLGDGTAADLGDGSVSDAFDLAMFGSRPEGVVFLGISVDGDAEMSPRLQLGSVPFAAFSQMCGDAATLGGVGRQGFATLESSGKLPVSQVPDLSSTYAPQSHAHTADDLPDLDEMNGTLASGQLPSHSHAFSQVTGQVPSHTHASGDIMGTLSGSQIPNLSSTYLARGRLAWGRELVSSATKNASGSVADPNGAANSASGPEKGLVSVQVPNIGCSQPQVWVSTNTNGNWSFATANVRHATLVDSDPSFDVRWINLYQEGGYTLSIDWLAFCP